jgi:hypothetical protein
LLLTSYFVWHALGCFKILRIEDNKLDSAGPKREEVWPELPSVNLNCLLGRFIAYIMIPTHANQPDFRIQFLEYFDKIRVLVFTAFQ